MGQETIGLIMLGVMILFIFLGAHIGTALYAAGMILAVFAGRLDLVSLFPDRVYTTMTSFPLEAVPLFVFMGTFLERSRIAEDVYNALYVILGKLPGSLLLATTTFSIIFGACTGILGAITVTMGLIALPAMIKANYDKALACGTVCAGGTLGLLIPPSIVLVLYGPSAGVSVAELFFASLVPGVMIGTIFLIYLTIRCFLNPKLGPPMPIEGRKVFTKMAKFRLVLTSILPTFILIIAVLGSILFGVATPTEAAAVGSVGTLVIAFVYRRLTFQNLKYSCWSTTKITAFIMFIVLGAGFFTTVFMGLGSGDMLTKFILGLQLGKFGTIALILGIIFILGFFMDWIGILLIFVPLSIPIVNSLGIHPLWFGTLFCTVITISCITPPFAYTAFYLKGIAPAGVTLSHIYRGLLPFVFMECVGILLIYLFPELCLWLPRKIM